MGDFLLGLLISIGFGIIIIVGILMLTKKKTDSEGSKQLKKSKDSNNNDSSRENAPTPKSKRSSKISNWFSAIAVIFLIIALIIAGVWAVGFVTKTYNSMKNAYHSPDKQYRTVLVAVDSITVYFGGDLENAKEIHINPIGYDGFELANATQPFCVYNAEDDKFCGEKGGNPDMGNSTANRVLRFVSQNQQKGKITIKLLRKQKIVVNN